MSTRELRVKFVGDAGNLKSTFSQVGAEAATAGTGFHSAGLGAETAGRSFTRVGRGMRGFGRAFKGAGLDASGAAASFASSIPALSGIASGLGAATLAGDALTTTFSSIATTGPAGLIAIAGLAIAAGAAFVLLKGNASATADEVAHLASASEDMATSASKAASASTRFAGAVRDLGDAARGVQHAQFDLADAEKAYAEAVAKSGRNSDKAKRALLDLRDAEAKLADARRSATQAGRAAIQQGERSSRAAENEAKQAREAVSARKELAKATGQNVLASAREADGNAKLAAAYKKSAAASKSAEDRHRANAKRAREAAGAIHGTSAAAETLRGSLRDLSATELNLAQQQAAIRGVATVAQAALAAVDSLRAGLQNISGMTIAGPTIGAPRGPGAKALKLGFEVGPRRSLVERGAFLRGAPRGSALDIERVEARGNRRAEADRSTAEDTARGSGKTEEQVRIAGERAYIKRRLAVITKLRRRIKGRYARRVGVLKAKRKALANTKVPAAGKSDASKNARQKAIERRQKLAQEINEILDELETLAANDADLVAEASRLGDDQEQLNRDAQAEQDDIAQDAADTAAEAADTAAEIREAGFQADIEKAKLTPGLEDDIAAADRLVAERERQYAEALATGDPRLIGPAAAALGQARQDRAQLEATTDNTDALNANTEALKATFTGSNTFSYQGQSYTLRSLALPSSDRLTGMEATI